MREEGIVIVGTGRMGLALGAAIRRAGAVDHLLYYGRGVEPPPHPLFDGEGAAEYRMGPGPVPDGTTLLVLAVPDGRLAEVAQEYARVGQAPRGCAAVHLAGALSSEVLSPLHAVEYAVGSMHPLQTVADAWLSGERLMNGAFALSGEPAAVAAARRLVSALGAQVLVVPPHFRPTYHAAAVFASNYLVAVLAVAIRLMGQADLSEEESFRALLPLMRGTLDNIEQLGVPAALTGPIPRGDTDTVRLHLTRLSPSDRRLYSALGMELVELARIAGLDGDRADELSHLLSLELPG
jgi:predicted short-subunit dehydrogenase-like oxidoreductase (DUF2520 family)